jgi:hypothetical protein
MGKVAKFSLTAGSRFQTNAAFRKATGAGWHWRGTLLREVSAGCWRCAVDGHVANQFIAARFMEAESVVEE